MDKPRFISTENKEEVRRFIEKKKEKEEQEATELYEQTQKSIRNLKELVLKNGMSSDDRIEGIRRERALKIALRMVIEGEKEAKIIAYTEITKEEMTFLSQLVKSIRSAKGNYEAEGNEVKPLDVVFKCFGRTDLKVNVNGLFFVEMQEDGSIKTRDETF
ncbi:hypothetical protein QA612_15265 [Evansella sp. AB-P1]|uniref:hypothetical protein n=1 Tax=Evansella sp. AB-P1 TaxID=3037653 RepID=UPI00241E874B|nr:hypothetical protein [Evansella sp. AB-P1]MDG5788830.1 hypothetical protein [Evansella sp. AB-P1]